MFQSQTRRLLPRNYQRKYGKWMSNNVSIADATLASSQLWHPVRVAGFFARVSIADATLASSQPRRMIHGRGPARRVSIADATLASSQRVADAFTRMAREVSIADATLASSQLCVAMKSLCWMNGFNRRRDACFLATPPPFPCECACSCFNRRRDACFLATV